MPLTLNNITFVSPSSLNALTCTTKALLRNTNLLVPKDSSGDAADVGIAIHKALAAYYTDKDTEAALATLKTNYPEEASDEPRLRLENTTAILRTFLDTAEGAKLEPINPSTVELKFCLPLSTDGTIALFGAIDLIAKTPSGQPAIVDHKTTGRIDKPWCNSFEMSNQITAYAWAARQLLYPDLSDCYINAIQLKELPTSDRKCKTHKLKYSECRDFHNKYELISVNRTTNQIEMWRNTALRLIKNWKRFEPLTPTFLMSAPKEGMFAQKACEWCDYIPICKDSLTDSQIAQYYQKRQAIPAEFLPLIAQYTAAHYK